MQPWEERLDTGAGGGIGVDVEGGYERWHVSLSGLQMEPLLKALWQDESLMQIATIKQVKQIFSQPPFHNSLGFARLFPSSSALSPFLIIWAEASVWSSLWGRFYFPHCWLELKLNAHHYEEVFIFKTHKSFVSECKFFYFRAFFYRLLRGREAGSCWDHEGICGLQH